jgi:hypothetical protein
MSKKKMPTKSVAKSAPVAKSPNLKRPLPMPSIESGQSSSRDGIVAVSTLVAPRDKIMRPNNSTPLIVPCNVRQFTVAGKFAVAGRNCYSLVCESITDDEGVLKVPNKMGAGCLAPYFMPCHSIRISEEDFRALPPSEACRCVQERGGTIHYVRMDPNVEKTVAEESYYGAFLAGGIPVTPGGKVSANCRLVALEPDQVREYPSHYESERVRTVMEGVRVVVCVFTKTYAGGLYFLEANPLRTQAMIREAEQAAREQAAREEAAREQAAREEAAREEAAREEAANVRALEEEQEFFDSDSDRGRSSSEGEATFEEAEYTEPALKKRKSARVQAAIGTEAFRIEMERNREHLRSKELGVQFGEVADQVQILAATLGNSIDVVGKVIGDTLQTMLDNQMSFHQRLQDHAHEVQAQHLRRLEQLVGSLLNRLVPVGTTLLPHPSVHVAEHNESLDFAFGEEHK